MKKSKFTEAQMAFALKQSETVTRVEEVCRKMGISQATFFNWKKKYAGQVCAVICHKKCSYFWGRLHNY